MKNIPVKIFIIIAAAAVLAAGGCAWNRQEKTAVKLQKFDSDSERTGAKSAAGFADGFISALKSGDFSQWEKNMPAHIKSKVNAQTFAGMRAELTQHFGEFTGGTYLGVLQNKNLRDYLWVLRFTRRDDVREVLYQVRIFRNEQGSPEISGFGVKRF